MQTKKVSFAVTIALIFSCIFLFFLVYAGGTALLNGWLHGGEKITEKEFFSSYASLFGALITVFVALFSIQKWWDRTEFEKLQKRLEESEQKNKELRDEIQKDLKDELLPNKIKEYIENHKSEFSQSLNNMIVASYEFNANILQIEFFETLYYSQISFLKEDEKVSLSRVLFGFITNKIKYDANKYGVFEKALELLSDISNDLLSEKLIIGGDKNFYRNLEYLHHEIGVIKYDAELSNILKAHAEKARILEENVKTLYGKYISRPSDSLACNKNYGLDDVQ